MANKSKTDFTYVEPTEYFSKKAREKYFGSEKKTAPVKKTTSTKKTKSK